MFVLCCWLFEALQRVYGRSELLGLSIYIGTETEVSVTNLAVNVASQLFDLILHIWAYLQHVWFFMLWTIEFIRRQQGTTHVLLYFISCITMYGTGQTNIIHVSLSCIMYHCITMQVTRYANIIWISDPCITRWLRQPKARNSWTGSQVEAVCSFLPANSSPRVMRWGPVRLCTGGELSRIPGWLFTMARSVED